ncbi:uncharacterized protein EV420DRAFT_1498184 [Desarmillaria tabescens]|uniref:Uncharacterized protein n=1 Tax=Armillaria tabescens TaxID=1929756 RepID=A0AA39T7L9_ARMTA|nr:uncharacterized protein EV420DRAFT_1498184 [Desarmillaria tabescens]KAK0470066.1 hypothetical protein EV420DRAFT_1498184 [Desarmillaria tabescens]
MKSFTCLSIEIALAPIVVLGFTVAGPVTGEQAQMHLEIPLGSDLTLHRYTCGPFRDHWRNHWVGLGIGCLVSLTLPSLVRWKCVENEPSLMMVV